MTPLYSRATVFYQRISRSDAAFSLAETLTAAGVQADARMGEHEHVVFYGGITRDARPVSWGEARGFMSAQTITTKSATFEVKRLTPTARLPERGSPDAAGLDLFYDGAKPITFYTGDRYALSTGISLTAPEGTYARIAPRSGLALKGIDVLAGVVDRDYTGEVKVILTLGTSQVPVTINPGVKIAQVIFESYVHAEPVEVSELGETSRGAGGFGSTGA